MENIEVVFLDEDNAETIARKTVELWVGSNELKPRLERLGISYTKVQKGLLTFYCLKGRGIDGTLRIRL